MKNKKLKLDRPLIVFDLETTGVNPQEDRIIEISVIKKAPGEKDLIKTRRINPGRPIPKAASEIHGIYDKDVKKEPEFKDLAKSLANLIDGCDVVGYNSNRFDIPFLLHEFERAEIYGAFENVHFVDVFNIFCHFNPRTLVAAYAEYCGKRLDAHKAENDALATYELLEAMVNEHEDEIEDRTIETLSKIRQGQKPLDVLGVVVEGPEGPVFSIGKHKGQLVTECRSYCDWIINKSSMSRNTKETIKAILTS